MVLLLLFAVPLLAGTIYGNTDRKAYGLLFAWVSGNVTLLAGFLPIALFYILRQSSLDRIVLFYSVYQVLLCIAAIVIFLVRRKKNKLPGLKAEDKIDRKTCLLWCIFIGLLLFQLLQTFRYSYGDGDDAFYLAVSTYAEASGKMYVQNPYTGISSGLIVRYAVAPFPIWIAYLARVTGIQTIVMARTVLPPILIFMSYAVYILLAKEIFPEKRQLRPVFLILLSVLVLFGDYSSYSTENFLLARSRQGKSALGNIFIPLLILLFLKVTELAAEKKKTEAGLFLALICTQACMCLSSTMGAFLGCLFAAIGGLLIAVVYRNKKVLITLALCCFPCVICTLLYLLAKYI